MDSFVEFMRSKDLAIWLIATVVAVSQCYRFML